MGQTQTADKRTAWTRKPMSDRQSVFIGKLLRTKELPAFDPGTTPIDREMVMEAEFVMKYGSDPEEMASFVSGRASALISWLIDLPMATQTVGTSVHGIPEEGVYVLDGAIVKVKSNKTKTNRYAMVWCEISGSRLNENGDHVHGEWEYAPAMRDQCKPENRMNVEQAKAFGIRYGRCVRCGTRLSDAKSVERAIGPVCIKHFSPVGVA